MEHLDIQCYLHQQKQNLVVEQMTTHLTAGEYESAYDKFEDTESLDINLVLGGRGGGAGDTSSSQDTHVTMLTALVEKRRDCVAFVSPYQFCNCRCPHLTLQLQM